MDIFIFFLTIILKRILIKQGEIMNCIGHSFANDKNALPKIKAFLDRVNSPKILATTDDIRLCRVSIEFSTNKIIRGKELMLIRNKEWVEEISNTTATLNLNDSIQIENIIIHLKMLMRKLDILMLNLYTMKVLMSHIKATSFNMKIKLHPELMKILNH